MSIYRDRLLLATKLATPQTSLKRVVPRLRLNSKLDAGMYVPFTLITAPAGFGKTILLGTWIQQRESKAAWVTLESKDNELVRFWCYVIAALERLYPVIGEQIETWLQFLLPSNIEEMLTVLINTLVALPHDVLLVLDNYQVITAPSIHHSLAFLLEHAPPGFHLIIATRVDPPLPLARFRVRGELVELRAADLRFTEDEAKAFLSQSTGMSLSAEDVAELNRSTEGWAAGLQLAALSLQGRDDQAGISKFINTFTGTNRHVLNYLTEEVLVRLPEDVQAFLLSTSILEQLNASLCDMLTQQSNGQAMLEWLSRADLFLIALDDQQYWYRYHHLFTDLLRHHLQQKQPTIVPLLHLRASIWYEQHEMLVDAVTHALAAREIERAANLIERCALSLIERGDDALMSSWLAKLPETTISARPLLCFLSACTFLSTARFEEYERALLLAEHAWRAEQNTEMLSKVFELRAYAALLRRDGSQALAYAQRAVALAREEEQWIHGNATVTLGCQSQRRSSGAQQAFSFEYVHAILRAFGSEAQPSIWINPQNGEDALIERLSEREQEVLNLIAAGLSNYEIAQKLVVTVSTIKTHLNNIYAKLHVHTRLQAVTKAYDVGVLRRGEVDTEPLTHAYSPEKMRYRIRTR